MPVILKKVIIFYTNLGIKQKLFSILLILMLLVSIVGVFELQISFKIYDEHLFNESAQILNLFSGNIENELKKTEKLSLNIMSDVQVQDYLYFINTSLSSYEKYKAGIDLGEKLISYSFLEKYIASINYFDNNENEYSFGRNTYKADDARKKAILASAAEYKGANGWIDPYALNGLLTSVRRVNLIKNTNLQPIGILLINIDINQLISLQENISSKYRTNLAILSEDKTIYLNNKNIDFDKIRLAIKNIRVNNTSYFIQDINGSKFFITYAFSKYTHWIYVDAIPYNQILEGITAMRTTMIIIYFAIFCIIVFLGVKFGKGIVNPVVKLSNEMKNVEKGIFEVSNPLPDITGCRDEIIHLNYDFGLMIAEINKLINENYIKQMIIKDTELKVLQAQIKPHFLYNTFESINWLAKVNGQNEISTMITALGNLLRNSININEWKIILEEEIRLLTDYLAIQKIRHGDKLDCKINIPEDLNYCIITKLTLQPIIENSIEYGLEKLTGVCHIQVNAAKKSEIIELTVIDNGPGIDSELVKKLNKSIVEPKGFGIGLKNIDERIKMVFGKQFGLSFYSEPGVGTKVIIRIPYQER